MAELVDAPASGAGILTGVEVRVFSWAPKINNIPHGLNLAGFLLLPEGGWQGGRRFVVCCLVSTHSHPKVAADAGCLTVRADFCFNTQPPEGGCPNLEAVFARLVVSTHSHPKVAARATTAPCKLYRVSTHSHPKVAASAAAA